jgi:membrane associated rhomboid family serine protease
MIIGREPFLYRPIERWGSFTVNAAAVAPPGLALHHLQFHHANFNHIVFNMIGCTSSADDRGKSRIQALPIAFYLVCGLAGPVMYIIFWAIGFLIRDPNVPMVGASAGSSACSSPARSLRPTRPC